MKLQGLPSEEKYGIVFQNENVKRKFKELLMNSCPLCEAKYGKFDDLKRHIRHKHEKQYCDICVKNLKVFPKEFRVYSRKELVEHRKTGDRDDTSHKGHPQCNFCNERYYDNDELLLHLRRNHFWCHFCENDGRQDYYCNYDDLRSHFRDDHFLCEEKECSLEKFTSVFRSDIDLKAHRLAKHSKKLSKVATKQARQVCVEIDYGKRKPHRDRIYNDRNPRGKQEMAAQKTATSDGVSDGDSEATALADASKESANGAVSSDPIVSDKNESGNAEMAGKSLNANAPIFLPSETVSGVSTQVSSSADATTDPAKGLKTEVVGKQWSRVIMGPISHDYGADFPSIQNSGARPKTSPPLQYENNRKVDKMAKRAPANHNNSQKNDRPGALLDSSKIAKAPPGLERSSSTRKMLPPGINIAPNTLLNSNSVASSAPPGLGQTSEKNKTGSSVQERNAALVCLIQSLLSDENFSRFKNQSGRFRRSEIDDSSYYIFISQLFGKNLDVIFYELVDLLPEREKQIQLLQLHGTIRKIKSSKQGGKPVTESKNAWQDEGAGFSSAGIVSNGKNAAATKSGAMPDAPSKAKGNASSGDQSQVTKDTPAHNLYGAPLSKKELERHIVKPTELDFPALPAMSLPQKSWRKKASPNPIPNAWGKSA